MTEAYAQKASSLYSNLALIPSIDTAFLLPNNNNNNDNSNNDSQSHQVLVRTSQTDLGQAKKRSSVLAKIVSENGNVCSLPFPFDVTTAPLMVPSPSGRFLALVRVGDNKDEPNIEIWDSYRLVHNVSCKGKGHSSIYTDEWFGTLEWSPDEKYVAYIAEPTVVNYSFWDKDCKEPAKRGHKFDFKEDWGETFTGLSNPSIYLLEIEKENIISVQLEDKKLSVGQVVWSPDGRELIFTGWPVSHRRLGLRFCYNRESAIYKVSVIDLLKSKHSESNQDDKTKSDEITSVKTELVSEEPINRSARFPRFSPDGKTLVYFSGDNIITHNGSFKLLKVEWSTKKTSIAVDVVARPSEDAFPGLFVHSFPRRCFLDSTHILTHTQWRTSLVPIVIDLTNGQITKLDIPKPFFSTVITDVVGELFLMIGSSPSVPSSLVFGKFSGSSFTSANLSTYTIHKSPQLDLLDNVDFLYKQITPSAEPLDLPFDILFVYPKSSLKSPLLLFPHGGPHSTFTGEYSLYVSFLVLMGYSVLMVNYRGSIGFGSDFTNALPGRCGELDVSDCVDAANYVLGIGKADRERIAVIGGSHGGYLALHLIGGTFENIKFKASIVRNPVTDIVGMTGTTDIPDWCLVETGVTKLTSMVPTFDQLTHMHKASPIFNIDKINTPTLFLIGEVDRRVPPSQGLTMHYALLERNVPSQLLLYPKNGHSLAGADADPDQAVNTTLFLNKYLN